MNGFEFTFIMISLIVVHEVGHIIALKMFGYKWSIKFTWWGILIVPEDKPIPIKQFIFVSQAGWWFSLPIALFAWFIFENDSILLLQFVFCSFDFLVQFLIVQKAKLNPFFTHMTSNQQINFRLWME